MESPRSPALLMALLTKRPFWRHVAAPRCARDDAAARSTLRAATPEPENAIKRARYAPGLQSELLFAGTRC